MQLCTEFQGIMRGVLAAVRARGPPAEDDTSVAALLLRTKVSALPFPSTVRCSESACLWTAML